MLIIGPVVTLDAVILHVRILQGGGSELAALGNHLGTCVVFHALAGLSLGQDKQLVYQDILQVVVLCLVLLVNLGQDNLVLLLALAGLHGT